MRPLLGKQRIVGRARSLVRVHDVVGLDDRPRRQLSAQRENDARERQSTRALLQQGRSVGDHAAAEAATRLAHIEAAATGCGNRGDWVVRRATNDQLTALHVGVRGAQRGLGAGEVADRDRGHHHDIVAAAQLDPVVRVRKAPGFDDDKQVVTWRNRHHSDRRGGARDPHRNRSGVTIRQSIHGSRGVAGTESNTGRANAKRRDAEAITLVETTDRPDNGDRLESQMTQVTGA